ncbi:MAG: hypothetical protein WC518_03405 [Patescibacteria group bacterium]
MKKIIIIQLLVLLAGALFAWFNFYKELAAWLNQTACTFGCTGSENPFITPCFYGALFFTVALILSIFLTKKNKA